MMRMNLSYVLLLGGAED